MRTTKRLILKEYEERYIEKIYDNFFSSEITAKYMLWRPAKNVMEAKNKIESWISKIEVGAFWIIHKKENDEPIGFVFVEEISPKIYDNIGIAIGEKFVSKGYGSEVVAELIDYIESVGGEEIYYRHVKENDASKMLALKFGFKFVEKNKIVRHYDNKEFEEIVYRLKINGNLNV